MTSERRSCRICGGVVWEFLDLGFHPPANRFLRPEEVGSESRYRLAVGMCGSCTMVQLLEEVPPEVRYHDEYRYRGSGSASHRRHFAHRARRLLATDLAGDDPFIVEIGCNDGVMLENVVRAGVRHLGVEPAAEVAAVAAAKGVRVRTAFFDEALAADIRSEHGAADVVFGANTICHIGDQRSLLRGVDALLSRDGVFLFEEPYLGTVVDGMAFDQIYDEHAYYFTARSVAAAAARFGFALVDVAQVPLHGGEIRYTLARSGRRQPSPAVAALLARERARGLADPATLTRFAAQVERIRDDLRRLLYRLREAGRVVVGYGAPAKASTVTNYCGIGPDLVPFVVDSTSAKQGRLVPGSHIPVRPPAAFTAARPHYALLFAWNHAKEIMANEARFGRHGGRWIRYVPEVQVD